MRTFPRRSMIFIWALFAALGAVRVFAAEVPASWVGTWATSPQGEELATAGFTFEDATLRQVVRVSMGGTKVRLRLSNAFGTTALSLHGVHLALADAAGAIRNGTDQPVLFQGKPAVTIPAGATMLSDPLSFDLPAMSDVAVSIHFQGVPSTLTGHPGSRANSYVLPGEQLAALALADAKKIVHWYFLTGLEVFEPGRQAIVLLGDSITDGYGCAPDSNTRWTDELARRLQANPATKHIGVLNAGIGGNRLLRDRLGPNVLARFDRDVLCQSGVRWLVVLGGINDIGTRVAARTKGESFASADEIIGAFDQMIERAHTHGIRVIGGTITPFAGNKNYWCEDGEADRDKINTWIRMSGRFDAVIDFDAALRSPTEPDHLKREWDSGDHLHPSMAGYVEMARAVDLTLFKN